MTAVQRKQLTREKLKQLLSAIGSRAKKDDEQPKCEPNDWRKPNCFNKNELELINSLTENTMNIIAEKFEDIAHRKFEASVTNAKQLFADDFLDEQQKEQQQNYYLAFGTEQNNYSAFVATPLPTAVQWVKLALGDSESDSEAKDQENKNLSPLEESLLWDITSTVVQALSEAHPNDQFISDEKIASQQLPFVLQNTEQMFKIDFQIKEADADKPTNAYFLIPTGILKKLNEKADKSENIYSAKQISNAILKHLQKIPVTVTALLGNASLTLEEIMNLQNSDIILLDKKSNEPASLNINENEIFKCRMAKSKGKYAVIITGLSKNKD